MFHPMPHRSKTLLLLSFLILCLVMSVWYNGLLIYREYASVSTTDVTQNEELVLDEVRSGTLSIEASSMGAPLLGKPFIEKPRINGPTMETTFAKEIVREESLQAAPLFEDFPREESTIFAKKMHQAKDRKLAWVTMLVGSTIRPDHEDDYEDRYWIAARLLGY